MMSFDIDSIRQQFPGLSQKGRGGVDLYYLDNAATTQISQSALDAYLYHEMNKRANVQRGSHYLAEQATMAYQQARTTVARYLNAFSADEIIFTSGTTASINLLALSLAQSLKKGDEIIVSEVEHHSNFLPWQKICQQRGAVLHVLPVLNNGRLAIDDLPRYLSKRCKFIAITHCSNVTGAISDVASIVNMANSVGAKIFLDGAQMAPHGPIDVQALGIDFYAFSGHKCFAPNGIGVLWGRKSLLDFLPPAHTGGGMVDDVNYQRTSFADVPRRFEAGTPPIAQAIALASALGWMMSLDWQQILVHEQQLFLRVISGLQTLPAVKLLGPADIENCQPVVSFIIDHIHPHDLCHILDARGVAVRGGHHCAQLLLKKMQVNASTRLSLALYNNHLDVDAFLEAIESAIEVLS